MTIQELLDSAGQMPFMAWKARAKDLLGADSPDTKAELIAALEDRLPKAMPPEEIAPPKGAVEVLLKKKYTPFKIMNEDGVFVDQDPTKSMISLPAGLAYLEKKEAQRVLERDQASPTGNTFRLMAD